MTWGFGGVSEQGTDFVLDGGVTVEGAAVGVEVVREEKAAKVGSNAWYAGIYGANERTVKRWKARGVETGDATPLGDAEGMRSWWERNMTQRIPDGINAAAVRARAAAVVPVAAEAEVAMNRNLPAAPVAGPGEEPVVKGDRERAERAKKVDAPVSEDELGLDRTLLRLLEMEVRLGRLATEPGGAKSWLDTISRIGPAATRLREENERQRKLIPRAAAEDAIRAFHVPIKNEIYQLAGAMCQVLGMPNTAGVEEKWRAEVDRLFARFHEEVFA